MDRLGERVASEGLSDRGDPDVRADRRQAECARDPARLGSTSIPGSISRWTAADQVDPAGKLIKGLGGALVREKLVARAAARVRGDRRRRPRRCPRLGEGCPVPVEIVPAARATRPRRLRSPGPSPVRPGGGRRSLRHRQRELDPRCLVRRAIDDPGVLERRINRIDGVVDNGLFTGMAAASSSPIGTACGNGSPRGGPADPR